MEWTRHAKAGAAAVDPTSRGWNCCRRDYLGSSLPPNSLGLGLHDESEAPISPSFSKSCPPPAGFSSFMFSPDHVFFCSLLGFCGGGEGIGYQTRSDCRECPWSTVLCLHPRRAHPVLYLQSLISAPMISRFPSPINTSLPFWDCLAIVATVLSHF